MAKLLIDTNILIDYSKGKSQALDFLNNLNQAPCVSALTVMEIYVGIRDQQERQLFSTLFAQWDVIAVDGDIAQLAGELRRQYGKSHGMGAFDAVLAATSLRCGIRLVTLNRKHFPMLDDLIKPY